MGLKGLIDKYSTSGPRYTSYPTAPHWKDSNGESEHRKMLSALKDETESFALYAHIPFCESLCYYCGCNIQITKDHSRSRSYVQALLKEIETVAGLLENRKALSQISWGGGTPTFLTIPEITEIQKGTLKHFDLAPGAEVSIEIDPRVTSKDQLRALRDLGFNRVSLGVQDFEPKVQETVNRVQPAEMTAEMLDFCRSLGYEGINLDLIYGLPHQTLETFERTLVEVARIRPDRIALYNYAHLPSLRAHQKILENHPMPSAGQRVDIFSRAYDRLTAVGYRSIGMDHFALETDELYRALTKGTLYRNFMGYTVKRGAALIGIGASAISELGPSYFQNVREAKDYEKRVEETGLSSLRGCLLSEDDLRRKWVIQSLMCGFELNKSTYGKVFGGRFDSDFAKESGQLDPFVADGLLSKKESGFEVTEIGRLFVRNIAMVFDAYLGMGTATYSKTV